MFPKIARGICMLTKAQYGEEWIIIKSQVPYRLIPGVY